MNKVTLYGLRILVVLVALSGVIFGICSIAGVNRSPEHPNHPHQLGVALHNLKYVMFWGVVGITALAIVITLGAGVGWLFSVDRDKVISEKEKAIKRQKQTKKLLAEGHSQQDIDRKYRREDEAEMSGYSIGYV